MLRFALSLLCICALPAFSASSEPLDRYAGRYRGCAVSAGEWVPIETTLVASAHGLSGTYVFIESTGRQVTETLRPSERAAPGSVAMRWHDIYGEGPAVFSFAPDASRFDGYWMTGTGADRFAWTGVRADDNHAAPDCRVPVS